MLYDFSNHIQELQDNSKKKEEILDRYTKYYGSLDGMDIYDTTFCKEYLTKFEYSFLPASPEDLEDDFDWDLLVKLVAGSFSSDYDLILDEEWKKNPIGMPKAHIYITVKLGEQNVTKDIEELWSFQIIRLYEIYAEEQMSLFVLMAEEREKADEERSFLDFLDDDEEPDESEMEQEKHLEAFNKKVKLLMKEAESARRLMTLI